MGYINSTSYPDDYEFSIEELREVTPERIYRWMCHKTYGVEEPGPDDRPLNAMTNTLKAWKKQLSYFMPNHLTPWDDMSRKGNPTRSALVNDLILNVTRQETRGLGRDSEADRAFSDDEFKQVLTALRDSNDFERRYRFSCMIKFMYHLIARGDDACHVAKSTLIVCEEYPWLLMTKLRWSKNVRDRRQCPPQVMLPCMDNFYCVYLALAIFLELWIGAGDGLNSQWLFCDGVTDLRSSLKEMKREADATKRALYVALKEIFDGPHFIRLRGAVDKLGVHSTKKKGTTDARKKGTQKDFVNYRARWKDASMQGRYADTVLPWPDIMCASNLCPGGVCQYVLKDGCNLSDSWLVEHVAPSIARCFGNGVAAILAKPLLWACLDSECDIVPRHIQARVLNALHSESIEVPPGENLVQKIHIMISQSQVDGSIVFEQLSSEGVAATGGGAGAGSQTNRTENEWKNLMFAKVSTMSRELCDMKNSQAFHYAEMKQDYERMSRNIARISMVPAARAAPPVVPAAGTRHVVPASGVTEEAVPLRERAASLSKHPRSLYILWAEYESGLGGNKPARLFTPAERGKVKFKYCRRKIAWDVIDNLIRRNISADVAIDMVYNACGGPDTPVNAVIDELRKFRRTGNTVLHIGPH